MKALTILFFFFLIIVTHLSIAKVTPEKVNDLKIEETLNNSSKNNNEIMPPEPSYGQMLYENHCLGCHESQLYIRANTKARSLLQLTEFVRMRALNQELQWGEEEITAVTLYLNQTYYHFSVSQRDKREPSM